MKMKYLQFTLKKWQNIIKQECYKTYMYTAKYFLNDK